MQSLLFSFLLLFQPSWAKAAPLPAAARALCPFQRQAVAKLLSPRMLAEANAEQILDTLAGYERRYGACKTIDRTGEGRFRLRFRLATVAAELRLDQKGRLEDFAFDPAEFTGDSFSEIEATLRKNFHSASLFVEREGTQLFAYRAEEPLNISRAYTLFLVRALNNSLARGEHKPQDTVQLKGEAMSVSFGLLHHWAPGTWITLDTLKNLIAVESDATAADLLVATLGKSAIEKEGRFLAPLLTGREAALLRSLLPPRRAPTSRAEAVSRLTSLPVPAGAVEFPAERFDLTPVVGWFASTHELCALARSLAKEPALQHAYRDLREQPRKPGESVDLLVEARDPGVAQSTLLFHDARGSYCLSLTLNQGSPLEERDAQDLLSRAEALLLKSGGQKGDKVKEAEGHPKS